MNKYIRTIFIVILAIVSYISAYGKSGTSDIRKLLDDVSEYIDEKPDSAWAVLNSLKISESGDEAAEAFYAILHFGIEYTKFIVYLQFLDLILQYSEIQQFTI